MAHVTAVLPWYGGARVVVPAARQLGDVAVAAARAAPVEPQRVSGHPVEPDPWRTAGTCDEEVKGEGEDEGGRGGGGGVKKGQLRLDCSTRVDTGGTIVRAAASQ